VLRPKKSWVERWLAGWRPYALLVGLCLCLYLPGFAAIPALDRDESRFAQATRQMLETGDFLNIRFQSEARNRKPAGIYWLQAAAVAAFSSPGSTEIWPYRVPSLVGATIAVLLTFGLGRALLRTLPGDSSRTAMIGAVFLAVSLGVAAEAHIAKTDAALLAAIVAGQGALGLAYTRSRAGARVGSGVVVLFWVAEIAAIFLKGPAGPALAIATAATLSLADRDARWLRALRPIAGIAAMVLAVTPWLVAIERATEGQFLTDSLGRDLWSKLVSGQESHGAPPFYYLVLSLIAFWPGSLYLAPALIRGWRRHEQPAVRFLLAWLLPAWLFCELVPTKLPHYVLPLYPALALLAASALAAGPGEGERAWARRADMTVRSVWVMVTLAIAAAAIAMPIRFGNGVELAGVVSAAALVVLLAVVLYREPQPAGAAVLVAGLTLALAVPAGQWVVPSLDRLWLSREAAALVARHPPAAEQPFVVVGYNEPSLVFMLGTKLQIVSSGGAAALAGGGEALVSSREDAVFVQGLAARGLAARAIDSIRGIDYSNGQRMVLTLYQVEPK
jgi:4-amino-4-deoxy-L-arabinose transferase-like glycosyltransferase